MKALYLLEELRDNDRQVFGATEDDLKVYDEAIAELEEAMKPKTCEWCKWEQETKIIKTNIGDRIDICKLCSRYEKLQDYYEPKVTP